MKKRRTEEIMPAIGNAIRDWKKDYVSKDIDRMEGIEVFGISISCVPCSEGVLAHRGPPGRRQKSPEGVAQVRPGGDRPLESILGDRFSGISSKTMRIAL